MVVSLPMAGVFEVEASCRGEEPGQRLGPGPGLAERVTGKTLENSSLSKYRKVEILAKCL